MSAPTTEPNDAQVVEATRQATATLRRGVASDFNNLARVAKSAGRSVRDLGAGIANDDAVQAIVDMRLASERAAMRQDHARSLTWNRFVGWIMGLAVGAGLALLLGCSTVDDCPAPEVECDDGGACWALAPGWSAWAMLAEPETLAALTEDQGGCYLLPGTDSHVCEVNIDCVPLLGRPTDEVTLAPSDCAEDGPWSVFADGSGLCWGVVDGVAVQLDAGR